MSKKYLFSLLFVFVMASLAGAAHAATSQPFSHNGHDYYVVYGNDPNLNTGNKVCAKYGRTCVGFDNLDNVVCKHFHADATESTTWNGSKNGFYCDGPP